MVTPNVLIITQARIGSTRFPEKILKRIGDYSLLYMHLDRLKKSKIANRVLVATTFEEKSHEIINISKALNIHTYQGSTTDVLDRFYQAAKQISPDYVVRVTSDCPLIDYILIDSVIKMVIDNNLDYGANVLKDEYPDGQDVEVFTFSALTKAWKESTLQSDREHVTPYIRRNSSFNGGKMFKSQNFDAPSNFNHIRMTVDEPADLLCITKLVEVLGSDKNWETYVDYITNNIDQFDNQGITRNEGYLESIKNEKMKKNSGVELYKKAKTLIPGGTMLLSKRPEMFLPDHWPAYYSKAKGCTVWDLDNNSYIDMSIMGIGTNTLGYGNDEVDQAVIQTVKNGNMSTLNCPEEVFLAEKLIEINPWADMVRFARSGGEANAIAIRIARAASGRDKVAICGYHGWHDWYLSVNHNKTDALSGHLLSGLDTAGVPKSLTNTVCPFRYNNFEELEQIVATENIGVIKMEVVRNFGPENNFLQKVRDLATKNNIVLVFDECTSGFRETYGGIFKKYGVEPDLTIFGKTISNGYALTAIVGKREVMEAAQQTFISSTFWTERIGPTAALKTLEIMEQMKSWERITEIGKKMQIGWKTLADNYNLKINISGIPALSTYAFDSKNAMEYKTFITQEMLKKGILANTSFYASLAHTEKEINMYFEALDDIYHIISKCENGYLEIHNLLEGPVCHSGFKRLN